MTQAARVEPDVDYYPSADCWVEEGGHVFLVGSRCPVCNKHVFPQRAFCDSCDTDVPMAPARLSRTGTLYSYSEVHVAPRVFTTPYVVGYVDLPEGVRVFAQVEHRAAELAPGERVEVTLGTIRTADSGRAVISYKFRKSGEPSDA
jgi:benzoylsuccinyl-CoA thiolase BbsA subunit